MIRVIKLGSLEGEISLNILIYFITLFEKPQH